MICNGLRKFWIADGKHRELLQVSGEEKEPQATGGKHSGKIPDGGQGGVGEFRAGVPEQVDQAHEDQPNRHAGKKPGIALEVAGKQQEERNKEMKDEHDDGNHSPLAVQAGIVKADFLGLIAGPDDEQLRKLEISPKHHKSEQQLAQVVNVAELKNTGERAGAGQQHHDGNHQRHGRNELAGDEQETIDGGCPMRGEGHDPIDGGESHYKNVEDDAGAGQRLEAAGDGIVLGIGVLLAGPAIKEENENAPNDKVQNGADAEAVLGEIGALKFGESAFAGGRGVEPCGVEILHTKKDGHEQDRDESENAGGGLQRAANDDAPIAAGQVLQHQEAERTQGEAQNKHESQKVGREKAAGGLDDANDANHQADDGSEERTLAETVDAVGRFVILRGHSVFPPGAPGPGWLAAGGCKTFSRTSGGNSETLALRLNCRART